MMHSLPTSPIESCETRKLKLPFDINIPIHQLSFVDSDLQDRDPIRHEHGNFEYQSFSNDNSSTKSLEAIHIKHNISSPNDVLDDQIVSKVCALQNEIVVTNTLEDCATNAGQKAHVAALVSGLSLRLFETSTIAYNHLIDQFKGNDDAGLGGLFDAYQTLCEDCHQSIERIQTSSPAQLNPGFDELSQQDQDCIVAYIDKLRRDDDYLGKLIIKLPKQALANLVSSYHPAGIDLSVLSNHSHGKTQIYSRDSQMFKLSRRIDSVQMFHHHDSFFSLLFSIFDTSSSAADQEYDARIRAWAGVCARMIETSVPGSEEFIIATIDGFMTQKQLPCLIDLEEFLLELLNASGHIIRQHEGGGRSHPGISGEYSSVTETDMAEFLDEHIERLLALLSRGIASCAVPQQVINLIHQILRNIGSDSIRNLSKRFIVSRWYFATFLSSLIVYPEVRGMLMQYYITSPARQFVLKKFVLRLQDQMFSIWMTRSSDNILEGAAKSFHTILSYFEPKNVDYSRSSTRTTGSRTVMLSHWEICSLIETLNPKLQDLMLDESHTSTSAALIDDSKLRNCPEDTAQLHVTMGSEQSSSNRDISPDDLLAALRNLKAITVRHDPVKARLEPSSWVIFEILDDSSIKLCTSHASRQRLDTHDASLYPELQELFCMTLPSLRIELPLPLDHPYDPLRAIFQDQFNRSFLAREFRLAQLILRLLFSYDGLLLREPKLSAENLLNSIAGVAQKERQQFTRMMEKFQSLTSSAEAAKRQSIQKLCKVNQQHQMLRIKVWYTSDVRHSAMYDDAARVINALEFMRPSLNSIKRSTGPIPSVAGWFSSSSRQRAQTQTLDLLRNKYSQTGTAKLCDDQCRLVTSWMTRNSIENFCGAEERIHRSNFEVHKLVNALARVSIVDNPVLWCSNLFRRERNALLKKRHLARSGNNHFDVDNFNSHTNQLHHWKTDHEKRKVRSKADSSQDLSTPKSYADNNEYSVSHKSVTGSHDGSTRVSSDIEAGLLYGSLKYVPRKSLSVPAPRQSKPAVTIPSNTSLDRHLAYRTKLSTRSENHQYSGLLDARTPQSGNLLDVLHLSLLSLILSDLSTEWAGGSETDQWIEKYKTRYDGKMAPESSAITTPSIGSVLNDPHYFFESACLRLLQSMSLNTNPLSKMEIMKELEDLVKSSLGERSVIGGSILADGEIPRTITRTRATYLEELAANCRERRAATGLQDSQHIHLFRQDEEVVSRLASLLQIPHMRPPTLFRDLQYVATFISAETLDQTVIGRSFWNFALAALSTKEAFVNRSLVNASKITSHHISRTKSRTPRSDIVVSTAIRRDSESKPIVESWLANSSIKDAAEIYLAAAKERVPQAARELALLYLSHSDLPSKATAPFALTREIFAPFARPRAAFPAPVNNSSSKRQSSTKLAPVVRAEPRLALSPPRTADSSTISAPKPAALNTSSNLSDDPLSRGTSTKAESAVGKTPVPTIKSPDPDMFSLALHWMDVAATGGDPEAVAFLRQHCGKT